MNIKPYSLYIASQEQLYLLGDDLVPSGLPAKFFSQQPWALILFKHIYCDRNSYLGDKLAANVLGHTNSRLFVKLVSEGIMTTLEVRRSLPVREVRESISNSRAKAQSRTSGGPRKAGTKRNAGRARAAHSGAADVRDADSEERLLDSARHGLLGPFLKENDLVVYDSRVAQVDRPIPPVVQKIARDVLAANLPGALLVRDVFGSPPPELSQAVETIRKRDRVPLRQAHLGLMSGSEYVELHRRTLLPWHKQVDMFLSDGLDDRLSLILKCRERFGKRNGWESVDRLLAAAMDNDASPDELQKLKKDLQDKLDYCSLPLPKEWSPIVARITQRVGSLIPYIRDVITATEVARDVKELLPFMTQCVNYLRGKSRKWR